LILNKVMDTIGRDIIQPAGAKITTHYWILVASKDYLRRGLTGGFIQANHGNATSLRQMHAGDWVIFYSQRAGYDKPEKLQRFTAIGKIADENVYPG